MTVMVRVSAADFVVEITSDREPYADLLDEMCARAKLLFLDVQAGLSAEDEPEA